MAPTEPDSPWHDALRVAALFATDPVGLGGISVRGPAGPVRDQWLAFLQRLMAERPLRRVPLHIQDERLIGGLDLPATLQRGRPVATRGVLAEADGGAVVLAMAERLPASTVARIGAVLDTQELVVERDGVSTRSPLRLGVVALDEGIANDEGTPTALLDRFAFWLDLASIRPSEALDADLPGLLDEVATARQRLPGVQVTDEVLQALCQTALALGIGSLRSSVFAVQAARAQAALEGRTHTTPDDAAAAARLVLAPRATVLPAPPPDEAPDDVPDTPPPDANDTPPPPTDNTSEPPETDETDGESPAQPLPDQVLAAARAAIPPGLLVQLQQANGPRQRTASAGKSGAAQHSGRRGRPAGVRAGLPDATARLSLIDTLRAAAPWQKMREAPAGRIAVRAQDFRVARSQQRSATTTVFVVDASGSAALTRLAETKGAVELLLADCYVRRDQVAVLAFRGTSCELLLPPTRSLVRAKRSLAALPGGGGTPLASALDAAALLAASIRQRGETPVLVLLTDGLANIDRRGDPGRERAAQDALAAARQLRAEALTVLLIDTSPRPQPQARALAGAMQAVYLPLPHASPVALSQAVKATVAGAQRSLQPL